MKTTQLYHRVKVLLLIFTGILIHGSSQAQFTTYDFFPFNTSIEIGRSIENRMPTGYSIGGSTNTPTGSGLSDWMYKQVSSAGVLQCMTMLGFSKADSFFSHTKIVSPVPGVEVLAGYYMDTNRLRPKASITFINPPNCTVGQSFQISDTMSHQWRQVISHSTGGVNRIALAGFIEQYNGPMQKTTNKILVAQYDVSGALIWAFKYNLPVNSVDEAYSICYQPVNNTYAVTGRTNAFGDIRVFILSLNMAGAPLGVRTYDPATGDTSHSRKILALPGGGFAVAGWTNANDPGHSNLWVFRVAGNGNVIWSAIYGSVGYREQWHSMVNAPQDTLGLTGYSIPPGGATEDVLLGKMNLANGNPIWHMYRPNTAGNDRGYDIKIDNNFYISTGQYVHQGGMNSYLLRSSLWPQPICFQFRDFQYDYALPPVLNSSATRVDVPHKPVHPDVKVTIVAANIVCTQAGAPEERNAPKSYELKQNYPNPFNPSTEIQFGIPEDGMVTIKIYNSAGKETGTLVNEHKVKGSYTVMFKAENLPSGIYYYKLTSGSFTQVRKMLLLK